MQPADEDELADMLYTCVESGKPCFIRYPRGKGEGVQMKENPEKIEMGKAEVLRESDSSATIWALGNMVKEALKAAEAIETELGVKIGVVNARFVKPLDRELLLKQADKNRLIVTVEDHVAGRRIRKRRGGNAARRAEEVRGLHNRLAGQVYPARHRCRHSPRPVRNEHDPNHGEGKAGSSRIVGFAPQFAVAVAGSLRLRKNRADWRNRGAWGVDCVERPVSPPAFRRTARLRADGDCFFPKISEIII